MTEDFFDLDKPIDALTMSELDNLGRAIFLQRQVADDFQEAADEQRKKLVDLQTKMISILDKFGRSSYTIPGGGMLVKTERVTVALPKTPEDKEAFYAYLKEKGIFDELISVNSMTLNAFYKQEFETAAEEGRAAGFNIPGISEPKTVVSLTMRKGK